MRLGTFLLGGLVGAAAAVYITNRSKLQLWAAMTNGNQFGSMMNKAKMTVDRFSNSGRTDASPCETSAGVQSHEHDSGGLDQVKSMVNDDPKLRAQVDEIVSAGDEDRQSAHLQ